MADSRKLPQITISLAMERAGIDALRRCDDLSDQAAARAVFTAMIELTGFRARIRTRPSVRAWHAKNPWDFPPRHARPTTPMHSLDTYKGVTRGPWIYHYWNAHDRAHYFKHMTEGVRRCIRLTDAMIADSRLELWIKEGKIREI